MLTRVELAHLGVVLALVVSAGCVAGTPTAANEGGDFGRIETPSQCSGDEPRPDFDLPNGSIPSRADEFELSSNESTVSHGESISFSLTNVADERRYTGVKAMYALQQRRAGAWQTVNRFRVVVPGERNRVLKG